MPNLHASFLAFALLATPNPDHVDCGTVGERYNVAVAKVAEALRAYGKCVATSDKRTDCAAEMQALDSAHDDFADAIDDAKDCR